jgi:hypothetical protein
MLFMQIGAILLTFESTCTSNLELSSDGFMAEVCFHAMQNQ